MKSITVDILLAVLAGLKGGLSFRQIQKQCGASKSTVGRISERLAQVGLSAQDALELDDDSRQALFYPPKARVLRSLLNCTVFS